MAAKGDSKACVHGILYHDTLISPHLHVILMDGHQFGIFSPLGMEGGGGWSKGIIEERNLEITN
jgi:hypothetical protein